jgi:hypothetical protein
MYKDMQVSGDLVYDACKFRISMIRRQRLEVDFLPQMLCSGEGLLPG